MICVCETIPTKRNASYIGFSPIKEEKLEHGIIEFNADSAWFFQVPVYLEQHDFAFPSGQLTLSSYDQQVEFWFNTYAKWMAISTTFRSRYINGLDDIQGLPIDNQDVSAYAKFFS